MNQRLNEDENGFWITQHQASGLINSGLPTVRRLAEEAGAIRRVGRNYRINRRVFLDYIEREYSL